MARSTEPATSTAAARVADRRCTGRIGSQSATWNRVFSPRYRVHADLSGGFDATAAARPTLLAHVGGPRVAAPGGVPSLRHAGAARPRVGGGAAPPANQLRAHRAAQHRAVPAGAVAA